jgi:hypothetical protein
MLNFVLKIRIYYFILHWINMQVKNVGSYLISYVHLKIKDELNLLIEYFYRIDTRKFFFQEVAC